MSNPLITIFIPTYQRPYSLKKAIESALNQNWKNLQVIVCDNCSSDETPFVVAELAKKDSRLHYICHEKNIGMLANYEFCISTVKTPYFSFLSDDDLLLPCFCEVAMANFSLYPDIAFFAGSTISLSQKKGVICVPIDLWSREGWFSSQTGLLELIGRYPVPTTVMFNKKLVAKAQIDMDNPLAWDCDLLIQLASQFPFVISKKRCGIFLQHENSFSSSQNSISYLESVQRLIYRVDYFTWLDEKQKLSAKALLKKTSFANAFAHLVACFSAREFRKGRTLCLYLLEFYPNKMKILCCFLISFPLIFFPRKKTTPSSNWKGFKKYQKLVNES